MKILSSTVDCSIDLWNLVATIWLPTFFKISSLMFKRRKKLTHVWNNLWASKWWQNFHFWVNYSLKDFLLVHTLMGPEAKPVEPLIYKGTNCSKHAGCLTVWYYAKKLCEFSIFFMSLHCLEHKKKNDFFFVEKLYFIHILFYVLCRGH